MLLKGRIYNGLVAPGLRALHNNYLSVSWYWTSSIRWAPSHLRFLRDQILSTFTAVFFKWLIHLLWLLWYYWSIILLRMPSGSLTNMLTLFWYWNRSSWLRAILGRFDLFIFLNSNHWGFLSDCIYINHFIIKARDWLILVVLPSCQKLFLLLLLADDFELPLILTDCPNHALEFRCINIIDLILW
jgi:hypothetical protein